MLIAGYGNRASAWSALSPGVPPPAVLPGVAASTRVCAHDRPGTVGESVEDPAERSRCDPVPQPRPAEETVADLHALLQAARVPGPYVLVAHSLGGLHARLYAAAHPADVAGLASSTPRTSGTTPSCAACSTPRCSPRWRAGRPPCGSSTPTSSWSTPGVREPGTWCGLTSCCAGWARPGSAPRAPTSYPRQTTPSPFFVHGLPRRRE